MTDLGPWVGQSTRREWNVRDFIAANATPDQITAGLNAAQARALPGDTLYFGPFTYTTTGWTVTKSLDVRFAPGAKIMAAPAIAADTITIQAAGVRFYGGELDGNRASNSDLSKVPLKVLSTSNFRWYDAYMHDSAGVCTYTYDSDDVWFVRPRFRSTGSTPLYAETAATARSGLHYLEVDIDRTAEGSALLGYGIQIHRNAGAYTDIRITGEVKLPVNPAGTHLCVEVWGGAADVDVDVTTVGGTTGVSFDRVAKLTGTCNVDSAKSIGIEAARGSNHNIRGTIEGGGVGASGLSVSGTDPSEMVYDLAVDNLVNATTSRCAKVQNCNGVTLRGRYRQRATGAVALELVKCSDFLVDANLDGRDSTPTRAAQDLVQLDQCTSGKIAGYLAHCTRNGVSMYDFSGSGSVITNVAVAAHLLDCATAPVGFFSTALGTGIAMDYTHDRGTQKTAAYTILPGERGPFLVDATAGAVALTLPPARYKGQDLMVVKTDASANAVTVARSGTDTINGGTAAISLATQNAAKRFLSGDVASATAPWVAV